MGPKVGFWGAKVGAKWVDTHFSPTLNPFRDFRENPLFSQCKGGGNCFLRMALRQSRPSIIFVHYLLSMGGAPAKETCAFTTLSFFSLVFLKNQGKPRKHQGFF